MPFRFSCVICVFHITCAYHQSGMYIQFAVVLTKFTSWVAQFKLTDRHSYAHRFFSAGSHRSTAQWEGLCGKRKCKCRMLIPYILLNIRNNWSGFVWIPQRISKLTDATCSEIHWWFQNPGHTGLDFEWCWAPMLDSEVPENLSISISESLALTAPDHAPLSTHGVLCRSCGIWLHTDIFWTPWGRSKVTLCVYLSQRETEFQLWECWIIYCIEKLYYLLARGFL